MVLIRSNSDATSQFCVTETLTNVESAVGQLNLSSLNFLNIMDDVRALLTLNLPSLACTNCTKEAFTIALGDFPDIVGAINPEVQGLCGASFIGELLCCSTNLNSIKTRW